MLTPTFLHFCLSELHLRTRKHRDDLSIHLLRFILKTFLEVYMDMMGKKAREWGKGNLVQPFLSPAVWR